jgi:hypothetical protein
MEIIAVYREIHMEHVNSGSKEWSFLMLDLVDFKG